MRKRLNDIYCEIDAVVGEINNINVDDTHALKDRRDDLERKVLIIRELMAASSHGKSVRIFIKKAKELEDPAEILCQVTTVLLPVWSSLSNKYFPNTVRFLPKKLPQSWSYDEALLFLGHLTNVISPEISSIHALMREQV